MPHFTRAELESFRGVEVPDLVGKGIRLAFVGINPGLRTAATQIHFGNPANRFRPALVAAGLLAPPVHGLPGMTSDDLAALVRRGVGITNLVSRATARADELTTAELVEGAARLESFVTNHRPRVVAVLGITAYRTAFRRPSATPGRQPDDLAGAALWVVPNPSGLNAHETVESLAAAYAEPARAAGVLPARQAGTTCDRGTPASDGTRPGNPSGWLIRRPARTAHGWRTTLRRCSDKERTVAPDRHDSAVITFPNELEVVITRDFDAPIALVFEVLTKPEHVSKWGATPPDRMTECSIDLRVGGTYHSSFVTGDGTVFSFTGTYLEVEPPVRTVETWHFNCWPDVEAVETMDLQERDGVTTFTWKMAFRDQVGRDHMTSSDGQQESLDEMERILGSLLNPSRA